MQTVVPESQSVQPVADAQASQQNATPLIAISGELLAALQGEEKPAEKASPEADVEDKPEAARPKSPNETDIGLTPEEEVQVDQLKERDREVRTHEQAHATVGGEYASAPTYDYETGPDNQQYAVAGEVKIDTAPVAGDPAATIAKMDVVIKAALAPAEPSSADRAVAAQASQKRTEAQAELTAQKAEEHYGTVSPDKQTENTSASPTDPSAVINLFA
ncbi:MAG: putative metalloprotease CJM1_0395 family protein [Sneathiella sp.]